MSDKVLNFIESNWDRCTYQTRFDNGAVMGMPYHYTVPSVGHFDELYYWDTYFTNVGLFTCGRAQLAKNNTDNILYLVNKLGYMPNGSTHYFTGRSQPPYLSEMVKDVYNYYKDPVWLKGAYEVLKKEYAFWQNKRNTDIGLARYNADNNTYDGVDLKGRADYFRGRIDFELDLTDEDIARHSNTLCESGWDMNPRWDFESYNYAAVELNSLLYGLEQNMAYFSLELGLNDNDLWLKRAEKRKELVIKYMETSDKLLLDYNLRTGENSKIFSAASFTPLFTGLADEIHAKAMADNLYRLETDYGIVTCEKNDAPVRYQWDYPNGWACLQYVTIMGLSRYGYKDEARRIAGKYVNLVEKTFEETGNLWEKYNIVDGNANASGDGVRNKMPSMMGWSAGVYLAAISYLSNL